ncbi:MAG: phosphate/phosphite/phosphonate ABC transporter substrate-binding protein [Syntrophobacterales bacterium]|nr:phosphate/phosphite/phosphonate ABC transporter substrate-binding protein [Syntrophobacterales bacterium]
MSGWGKAKLWVGGFTFIIIWLCLLGVRSLWSETRELSFGVTYVDEPVSTFKRWEPLGAYFSKILNANVKTVPLDFSATIQWIEAAKVQLILTNPLAFLVTRDKAQLVPIGVIVQKIKGNGDKYGGVIIVRSDSNIKSLQDIGGKTIGIASRFSLGGGIGGLALLEQEGVKIEQVTLRELKTQDNVVFSVLNKTADVGIVRTGIIEKLSSENKINRNDLRVIRKVEDNFPFVHSTPLWPEWILSLRSSDFTQQEIEQLKKSILHLDPSSEVLMKTGLAGFKDPTEMLSANAQFFDAIVRTYNKLSK